MSRRSAADVADVPLDVPLAVGILDVPLAVGILDVPLAEGIEGLDCFGVPKLARDGMFCGDGRSALGFAHPVAVLVACGILLPTGLPPQAVAGTVPGIPGAWLFLGVVPHAELFCPGTVLEPNLPHAA